MMSHQSHECMCLWWFTLIMFESSLNLDLIFSFQIISSGTNALKWELNSVFSWDGISGLNLIRKSFKTQFRDRFTWKRYFRTGKIMHKMLNIEITKMDEVLKVKQKALNPPIIVKTFSSPRWQTNVSFVTETNVQLLKVNIELENHIFFWME